MSQTIHSFCDTIETIQGILFLRSEQVGEFTFRFYEGLRGLVIIDFDEENFTDNVGKAYLMQLGLEYLVNAMYPPEPEIIPLANKCPHCEGVKVILKGEEYVTCPECKGSGTSKVA